MTTIAIICATSVALTITARALVLRAERNAQLWARVEEIGQ